MLIQLLKHIHENDILSFSDLLQKLEIKEAFLNQLIFELVKNDYLEKVDSSNSQCNNKSCTKSSCLLKTNPLKAFKITGKGRDLLLNQF